MPSDPRDFIEILLIFVLLYAVLRLMQGTIAGTVLRGVGFFVLLSLFAAMYALSYFGLTTIGAIFKYLLAVSVTALIIIFQPELRRGLLRLGRNPLIGKLVARETSVVEEVVKAAVALAKDQIGALIAFEGRVGLDDFVHAGVLVDAAVRAELIQTIFWPGTALHDGAIVIRDERIAAGACLFPLTDNPEVSRHLGTRHRAAIGVTEETDAVCVVVSEETGTISVTRDGKITRDCNEERLRTLLRATWRKGGGR
jgi:diadenylate cyclase